MTVNLTVRGQVNAAQSSYEQLRARKRTPDEWHHVLGHAGQDKIDHLSDNVEGAIMLTGDRSPKVKDCQACALSKSKVIPSRRQRVRLRTPFGEVAMDIIQFSPGYNGHMYLLHAYDLETSIHFARSSDSKAENKLLEFFHSLVTFVRSIGRDLKILHSDNDTGIGLTFRSFLQANHVAWQPSAPYTPAQDPAERPGGVITTVARSMRIHSNLPEHLWPEITCAAVYIINRTPIQRKK